MKSFRCLFLDEISFTLTGAEIGLPVRTMHYTIATQLSPSLKIAIMMVIVPFI